MVLEKRLNSLAAFTDEMFRRHAEAYQQHTEWLKQHDRLMAQHDRHMQEIDRQIAAMNEATARRLDAQAQDVQRPNEAIATLDARLNHIAEMIDRFIQG
jgi:seryl-tRNA synthetase